MGYKRILKRILGLDKEYAGLSDDALKAKTDIYREEIAKGKSLEALLPYAFATVRAAASRTIGQKHFPVQLLGGISLHYGEIIEMKTGEGKTLTATTAAYLNALKGKVHIVTVNDYLARYNMETMMPIYSFLGISAGCITSDMDRKSRKEQYKCDIVYGTSHEFCFDYLNDNMRDIISPKIQSSLDYAIIDEADSILIDEAKMPLIISGTKNIDYKMYKLADEFVITLKAGKEQRYKGIQHIIRAAAGLPEKYDGDFYIDSVHNMISLTESGINKADEYFGIYFYDSEDAALLNSISNALRARYMLKRDEDYIVSDGQIKIIDPSTGRVLEGRKYNGGLHQALEIKEGLPVSPVNENRASTTYKNYFSLYSKFAGMTGTALSEKEEFKVQYEHRVRVISPNKKCIRKDHKDKVFLSQDEKYEEIIKDVEVIHSKGQPVLIGTSSIQESEYISSLLKDKDIPHSVLNAKQNADEAAVVAKAGEYGSVTVATNMAGRGTDIKLGGLSHDNYSKINKLGGLYVIGTERNVAKRIDDQLIGRSGRQGDAGESCFYISPNDSVIRTYKPKRAVNGLYKKNNAITKLYISHTVKMAQKLCQRIYLEQRKSTNEIDDINAVERENIYKLRESIISSDCTDEFVKKSLYTACNKLVVDFLSSSNVDIENYINANLKTDIIIGFNVNKKNKSEVVQKLSDLLYLRYMSAVSKVKNDIHFDKLEYEKRIILKYIDKEWVNYLNKTEIFASTISLYNYGSIKPIEIYKEKILTLHDSLYSDICYNVAKHIAGFTAKRKVKLDKLNDISIKIK